MNLKASALVVVCALLAEPEPVCVHPSAGSSCRVSLPAVRRAYESVQDRLASAAFRAGRLSADAPFDSGLPACGARRLRVERTELPVELVGKTIAFARDDRMPKADVRVATSCRRLSEVDADALADGALVERLRIRCVPTVARVLSEVDLELVEGP